MNTQKDQKYVANEAHRPITYTDHDKKAQIRYDSLPELMRYFERVKAKYIESGTKDEYRRYGVTNAEDYYNYRFCIDHDIDPRIAQFVLMEAKNDALCRYTRENETSDYNDVKAWCVEKDGEIHCVIESPVESSEMLFPMDVYDTYRKEYSDDDLIRDGNVFSYLDSCYDPDWEEGFDFLAIVNDDGVRKIVDTNIEDWKKCNIGSTVIYAKDGKQRLGCVEKVWMASDKQFPRIEEYDGKIIKIKNILHDSDDNEE